MQDEITEKNYKDIDIESITMDRNRLGPLVFGKSNDYLKKLQGLFSELEELEYKQNLTPSAVARIESERERFIKYLNEVRLFNIKESAGNRSHPTDLQKQLEDNIVNFYDATAENLRPYLVYLRQEVTLKSRDEKSALEAAKQAQQARKESEEILEWLRGQQENISKEKSAVETGHGELASKVLATHFDTEAGHFAKKADSWLKARNIFFRSLVGVVGLNLVVYLVTLFGFWFDPDSLFNIQYLALKVAFIALLSYGLVFSSKNYRVNSNLAVTNRHRRSVAQTIEDYLGTNPRQEIQDEIVKEGVRAMFQHANSGYLSSKENPGDGNPATEYITNIIKSTGEKSG